MASQPSGSKPKKGLRTLIKETLHVRSRSKSPSQLSQSAQQHDSNPTPPGPTSTSKIAADVDDSHGGPGSKRADGTTRPEIPRPVTPPNVAWVKLRGSLQSLRNVAAQSAFAPFVSAVEELLSCLDELEPVAKNWPDYEDRATSLSALSDSLEKSIQESQPIPTTDSILGLALSTKQQVANLQLSLRREGRRDRLLAEGGQGDLAACYGKIEKLFWRLEANVRAGIWSAANRAAVDTVLQALNPVKHCAYNSSRSTDLRRTCAEGTRTGVLDELNKWMDESTSAPIFWISGTAGTGKSTIARTFSDHTDSRKLLAASIFCGHNSTESKNATRIVPTIAHQMAQYSAAFERELYEVVRGDPEIMSKEMPEQFTKLVLGPLARAKDMMPQGMLVTIDGLEEYEDMGQHLLGTVLQCAAKPSLKFLISSRQKPEKDNRTTDQAQNFVSIRLDNTERSVVRSDIRRYLQAELSPLTPTGEQIGQLVDRTDMLFICAAILARFILLDNPQYSPQNRLELILSMTLESTKKHAYIDALYTTILHSVLGSEEEHGKHNTRVVLWTVLFAQEPVGVETIGVLGGIDGERVRTALQPLRPVLAYSNETELVSVLDESFSEYILDHDRSGVFFYDIAEHSRRIAEQCFRVMKAGLRFNICGLESSFVRDQDVKDLESRIDEKISPTLGYACRHWASHLELAAVYGSLLQKLDEFISMYLLFWMEVMNLKKEMRSGIVALMKADRWIRLVGFHSFDLAQLVADAYDFVTSYGANPISQSTPHIYISALPFCRRSSKVYQIYSRRTSGLLDMKHTALAQMELLPLAVWTTGLNVLSVAYSPEGGRILYGRCDGTATIRDAYDGRILVGPVGCHLADVNSVAFSPDGCTFATGSSDHTIRIWDAVNGNPTSDPFQGHTGEVDCIAFSPDGTLIASGSGDSTVRIWSVANGATVVGPLQGHANNRSPVVFSPDGSSIASANGSIVFLANICTSLPTVTEFRGHENQVRSIAFSPEGSKLISGSYDNTIRVWSTCDGRLLRELIGHADSVNSVGVSPDGRRIVSGSGDKTIRVWDIGDGSLVAGPFTSHNFIGHDQENAVEYSPDGRRFISASMRSGLRLWSVRDGVFPLDLPATNAFHVTSLILSPSESRIYFTSSHRTTIWDVRDGTFAVDTTSGNLHTSYSLPLSPDGAAVAVFLDDHSVEIVSTKDGSLIAGPFRGHTASIASAAFSPDGSYLITGSEDGTARVWNIENGCLASGPFAGPVATRLSADHFTTIRFVSLSSDCLRAVTQSRSDDIRVWDVRDSATQRDATVPDTSSLFSSIGGHSKVFAGWTLQADGWMVNGDGSLLFWIPIDFPSKPSPDAELIIGRYGSLGVPKQGLLLGQEWERCYVGD